MLAVDERRFMKTVGIIFNPDKTRAKQELEKLSGWLRKKNCKVIILSSGGTKFPAMDFALSLGGDGTMLRVSRFLAPLEIPVLGINLGSLGFLAETDPKEMYSVLSELLEGKYEIEERMMLDVTIKSKNKTARHPALNDCVIHSGSNGRIITVTANINNEFLADYIGDGLIVATPTGSTAYSLAASGPIVHPHLSVFILSPVCPHTLAQRPLIVSTEHILSLQVTSKSELENPVLSLDGQISFLLKPKDLITITSYEKPLRLITNPKRNYFQVLRTKLKWGERG